MFVLFLIMFSNKHIVPVSTGSFQVGKQMGHGINHPPLSSVKVKERVELQV
jgi:hypothetical protein